VKNIQNPGVIPIKTTTTNRPTRQIVFKGSDGKLITLDEIIMPSICGEQTSIDGQSGVNSTENVATSIVSTNNNKRKHEILGDLVEKVKVKEIDDSHKKIQDQINSQLSTLKKEISKFLKGKATAKVRW